jgi:hypothetical protein
LGWGRGRILGAEAFDAPEDDEFLVAGMGENAVPEKGDTTMV